jgi:predicted MPP superfamily phosphohydrolase
MSTTSSEISTDVLKRLKERIRPRLPIEAEFERIGHTYRHGPLHFFVDRKLLRPSLKVGLSLMGLYRRGRQNAVRPQVRRVELVFDDLPHEFDGFRLMQLSDFHIDGVDGLAEAIAGRLREVECDACVFTGDYRFDDRGPCDEVYPRMRTVVEAIQASQGVYGILGNHDAGEIAIELQRMGVHMLVNDAVCISHGSADLWLVGVDDNFDYNCHNLSLALGSVPEQSFKVLLAHAPELFEEAERSGIQLNLSGHTHAGQIRVPGWGALKHNARCPKEYAWGSWRHGKLQGFTSCGIGSSSVPVRFNCPPEIVLFELRSASAGRGFQRDRA